MEALLPAHSSNAISQRQGIRTQRIVKKSERKSRTTELLHCYYCPQSFRFKTYLRRHVLSHLKDGGHNYEVTDWDGNKIHPAYLEEKRRHRSSSSVNKNQQQNDASNTADKPYKCHLCPFRTKHKTSLRAHLERKAKRALMPDLTCFHCGWTAKWKRKLEVHMHRHLPANFQCELCLHRTHTVLRLRNHLRSHAQEKAFACNLCDQRFGHNHILQRHLATHKFRNHKCPHCKFSACKLSALTDHIQSVHTGPKYYACPNCDFKAREIPDLRSHVSSVHGRKLKKVRCRFCDFETADTNTMNSHEHRHTSPEGYACDECAYVTKSKSSMTYHMRTHTGEKPYACDLCEYRSTSGSGISRHMATHNDARPFKCLLCDLTFKTKQSARLHEDYTHKLIADKYYCQICNFKTNLMKNFKDHALVHTDEKPFPCKECDYVCKSETLLRQHMKKHTGDRPHKCDLCNFRAVNSVGVSTHMHSVHPTAKPYTCMYCSTRFKLKTDLLHHEREHTGKKKEHKVKRLVYTRRKCRFCDFETVPVRKLRSHYEQFHPDEMLVEVIPELAERKKQRDPGARKKKPKSARKCRFCNFESTLRRKVRIHEQLHIYEMMGKFGNKVMAI